MGDVTIFEASSPATSRKSNNQNNRSNTSNKSMLPKTIRNLSILQKTHQKRSFNSDEFNQNVSVLMPSLLTPVRDDQSDCDLLSNTSSAHFTLINGFNAESKRTASVCCCCCFNKLKWVILIMTIILAIIVAIVIIFTEYEEMDH